MDAEDRDAERQRDRWTDRPIDRETEGQRCRGTDRPMDRETEGQRGFGNHVAAVLTLHERVRTDGWTLSRGL